MLENKKILVVDDETDVLETVVDVLEGCLVETARTFDEGLRLISANRYDLVILDIMGVKGLHLLESSVGRGFPSIILTAPAFNPEYIVKSGELGASACLPKEDLSQLDTILTELFEIMERGESPWRHTMKRLEPHVRDYYPETWKETVQRVLGADSESSAEP